MNKIFTLIGVLALYFSVNAQTVIKNSSFETWGTYGTKQFPADWYFDTSEVLNGSIVKANPGSAGSSAVRLGCYVDAGILYGAMIEIFDTVTVRPGSLSFDYKIFNAPGFIDGLYVDVYLYDDSSMVKKFSFNKDQNNSGFATATINFSYLPGENPTFYRIEASYLGFNGDNTQYAIIDNFRFGKNTGIDKIGAAQKINVWPNPATGIIHITNSDVEIKTVNLISVDGKRTEIAVQNSAIDISGINTGIYILEMTDANGRFVKREKISIR